MDNFINYIVIGAGLSGLNLAKKINDHKLGSVLVLEKSRGVGGRMATRRTLETRFDHGAQFYRVKPDILNLHNFWSSKESSQLWFSSKNVEHWSSPVGMTALAKTTSAELNVALEKQVSSLQLEKNYWKVITDKNEEWFCENLIITAPLPQTIKLLESESLLSQINTAEFDEIKRIDYSKALILLAVLHDSCDFEYCEFGDGNIFSIANQESKGVSSLASITVTMGEEFSSKYFEAPEELILQEILSELNNAYPQFKIKSHELKKWRYCRPLTQYRNKFLEMAPHLYLIGDAFGGASLAGAVRSSDALFENLIKGKI